ncbi:WG repeat-containing protein [Actinoplanes sp. NPDC000266]
MSAPGDFDANASQHGPVVGEFRQGEYYEPRPDQTTTPDRDAAEYDRPEPVTAPPYLVADAGAIGLEQYDPSVSPVSSLPTDHPLPTGPVAGPRTEPVAAPEAVDLPAAGASRSATEGLAVEAPDAGSPAAEQPRGLGWLLSQSGLGAITPLPPPEPLLAMIEQPVPEPEPEEIQPVSGAPEKQNWFVPPADDELDTVADDDHAVITEQPEADQYAAAPSRTEQIPAEEPAVLEFPLEELDVDLSPAEHPAPEPAADHPDPEPQAHEPAIDNLDVEPQAGEPTTDHLDSEPQADEPTTDHLDSEPQADEPTTDHLDSEPQAPEAAADHLDSEPQADEAAADYAVEPEPYTHDQAAEDLDTNPVAEPEADQPAVDQPAAELWDEQPSFEHPATETPAASDHQPAVDHQVAEPQDEHVEVLDVERQDERPAVEVQDAEQADDHSAAGAVASDADEQPVDDDDSAVVEDHEAPHIEFELGPEWAQDDEVAPEAEPTVDELLEVAEAPSAEFGSAESADGEAVDVELLEPTPEPPAEEPADEIVDAELVDESRPELAAAVEGPDPEPTDAEPEKQDDETPEDEAPEDAAPEDAAEAEPEPAADSEPETPEMPTTTTAPSLVAVPRVPAVPIRQRGDKVGPQDRRADPEQVLSAYPWVFDPATLRERIEETDPMGVVIDRLTDKLEYAERDSVRARLLSLRAVAERLLDELDPALEDAEAGLEHARRAADPVLEATVLGRLAHVRHWRGEYAEADRLYAEASSPELPTRLLAELHELAGRSAFEQGRYLEAVNHFETALDLRKGTDPDLVERIELALDTITGLTTEGWGPYPRTEEEIGGLRPAVGPTLFQDENGWGAVDEQGQVVVEARYDRFATVLAGGGTIDGFTAEGLAVVESDGRQGVIDRTGQVVLPLEHAEVRIHPAAFLVADRFGLWGALGRDGAPMVELTHSERADVIEEIERRVPATRPVL